MFVCWETLNRHIMNLGGDITLYLKVKFGNFFFFASLFDTVGYNGSFRLLLVQSTRKIIHYNGSFGPVTGLDINVC